MYWSRHDSQKFRCYVKTFSKVHSQVQLWLQCRT